MMFLLSHLIRKRLFRLLECGVKALHLYLLCLDCCWSVKRGHVGGCLSEDVIFEAVKKLLKDTISFCPGRLPSNKV